jgi:hypothetical protein
MTMETSGNNPRKGEGAVIVKANLSGIKGMITTLAALFGR